MEEILAIILIFGGGTLLALAHSPIGKALAARIRGELPPGAGADPAVLDELDRLRQEMTEVQERLDFAERLLASRAEPAMLEKPEEP